MRGDPPPPWKCKFCYRMEYVTQIPPDWDLLPTQFGRWTPAASAFYGNVPICPDCQTKVARDGGFSAVKAGAYYVSEAEKRDA